MSHHEPNPFLSEQVITLEVPRTTLLTYQDIVDCAELGTLPSWDSNDSYDLFLGEETLEAAAVGHRVLNTLLRDNEGLEEPPTLEDLVDDADMQTLATINDQLEGFAELLQQWTGASFRETDNRRVLEALLERKKSFELQADSRREELENVKEQFAQRMHFAIEHQGLPLTHEQLDERLAKTSLHFAEPFELGRGVVGQYRPYLNAAFVSIEAFGDELIEYGYHELLHAVSGNNSAERQGLRIMPDKDGLWADEAMTDILTYLLLDDQAYDYRFDTRKKSLWNPGLENIWLHIGRTIEKFDKSYPAYKKAFIKTTMQIPSSVLANMYFKRDNDSYEEDKRAGTHAEREFQRSIKRAGGAGRVALMRQINDHFKSADTISKDRSQLFNNGEAEEAKAGDIAIEIETQDTSTKLKSRVERAKHRRAVRNHTRSYQARIAIAKTVASERPSYSVDH